MQFTSDGMNIDTFSEIFAGLVSSYKEIYGEDIDLAQNTPDGQRVGVESKARADMQAFILAVYNSFDPDLAEGIQQDKIAKVCGITRRPATKSTWDIDVTATQAATLPDYTIKDDLGQEWRADLDVLAGTTTVTFLAVEWGAVTGLSGATFEQVTILTEVTTLTTAVNATVGLEEETAEEFRIRRNKSVQNPSLSTVGGLFSRLANTAGVTDAIVYENDQDTTDTERNMVPHSIWAIVEGGTVDDIAETITLNKTGGTALKGSTSGTYIETVTRPDGTEYIITHTKVFDRPTYTDLFITLTATRTNPSVAVDQALIKENLASRSFTIGDGVNATALYGDAYKSGSGYVLTDMLISDDDITYTDESLSPGYAGKFSISAANITITEVIP